MSADLFANLQAESDESRVDFLKSELALCFTFSVIASMKYEAGNRTSAERSMSHAQEAYSTVARFLSDPKHSKGLTVEQTQDITAELERLRDRLDALPRLTRSARSGREDHLRGRTVY